MICLEIGSTRAADSKTGWVCQQIPRSIWAYVGQVLTGQLAEEPRYHFDVVGTTAVSGDPHTRVRPGTVADPGEHLLSL